MLLGVSIGGAGLDSRVWDVARTRHVDAFPGTQLVDVVRSAEREGFTFVHFSDSFATTLPDGAVVRRLDALLAAARVGPITSSIGLVAEVTTTHTEPFHVAKNVGTLDFVSAGRAGWQPSVSRTPGEAALFGRKDAAPMPELAEEASEFVDVVRRLWDSWEDDAVIRDRATGRYVDRDKLHTVDFEGRFFSVRGPSITPRSPQGQAVVLVDASDDAFIDLAARHADIVVVDTLDVDALGSRRELVRAHAAAAGRDPAHVRVLAVARVDEQVSAAADRCEQWWRDAAVDGVLLRARPRAQGLDARVAHLARELRARGLVDALVPGGTFRDHLGLERPTNRYAVSG